MKNKYILFGLIALIICSFFADMALAQSAKDAIKALMKVEAQCQTGISYVHYGPVLGDARYEVNLYLASPETNNNESLKTAIVAALKHYQSAQEVWQFRFSQRTRNADLIDMNTPEATLILQKYPKAYLSEENGGATIEVRYTFRTEKKIFIPLLLNVIWAEASGELQKAMTMATQ